MNNDDERDYAEEAANRALIEEHDADPFAPTHRKVEIPPSVAFAPRAPIPGIYGWSPGNGGVHFHRVAEPLRVAAAYDIRAATGNRLDDEVCEQYDTILVHMLHTERDSEAWRALERADSHRMIFDLDDAMWAPDAWGPFRDHYTPEVMERVWDNIRRAHVVTTPSPFIAEYVSAYNPNVWVVPNTVPAAALDVERAPLTPAFRRGTVGYQGSVSHALDWTPGLTADLAQFLREQPTWDMHLFGPDNVGDWDPTRVRFTPWQAPGLDYYREVARLDVGLAPTKNTVFNRGKSGLRAIEYAALGIVGIFPDHEIYRDYVGDGITAIVTDPRGVRDALRHLADHPGDWHRMSLSARTWGAQWTTEKQITNWTEAWNSGH